MPATYYPAIIDRSATGYGVSFPNFDGVIATGDTVNEACIQAERALAFHIETMVKDGDALPMPSSLSDITAASSNVATVMVRVVAPARIQRVLVSIDENLLRQIDAVATNRSAFFSEAARAALAAKAT